MMTFGSIAGIVFGAVVVEKRCRDAGNVDGALTARKFSRLFVLGAGGMVVFEWIRAMIDLI